MSGSWIIADMKGLIARTAKEHTTWVDGFGLHSGKLGPLGELIRELEGCLQLAEKLKSEAETGDD